MKTPEIEKFDLWCIVEMFGHSQIAGRCTEQNVAGTNMLRVDVPETKTMGAFTKLLGSGAIYAINPVTEDVCKLKAAQLNVYPIDAWSIKEMQSKILALGQENGRIPFEEQFDDEDLPY
jgi:hypothetical protein